MTLMGGSLGEKNKAASVFVCVCVRSLLEVWKKCAIPETSDVGLFFRSPKLENF